MTSPPPATRNIPDLTAAMRQLYLGGSNNTGTVTLRPSQTTTVIPHQACNPFSHISIMPLTANAQTAFLAGIRVSARSTGSFTLTHASNAAVDQTFTYSVTGGA